ncbi:MAG: hypothetical protein FD123_3414 [Bacteroidetes bacterium]|nr:MAG: hypothetical protein FD123_3414 [Bacteroidota bacterium]
MNRLHYILLVVFAALLLFSFSPPPAKRFSLLVAEYDVAAAQNHQQHLWRYNFEGGLYSTKEKVITVQAQKPGEKSSYVRLDLGNCQVYRDRWVVSGIGNVIDVQQKKVILDQKDQFVKGSGDSMVFYTNDIIRGKYYSVLDLKNGAYAQVKSPAYKAIKGQDVEPDCSLKNYKIHFYPASAAKVELVRDAGYGEDLSRVPGGRPQLPFFWLDNTNFVYPNFSQEKNYVALYKVNVPGKSQEKIGEIDQLAVPRAACRFFSDPDGNPVFVCSGNYYLVDLKKKKVSVLQYLPVGNGFEIGIAETAKGHAIRYKGQDIGNYFCDPEKTKTAEGCIAFTYEMVIGEERYLQGVATWTSVAAKWKSFDNSDVAAVVGWMEY